MSKAGSKSPEEEHSSADAGDATEASVIVWETGKPTLLEKKKKRQKYSKGLAGIQRFEDSISAANLRIARAVAAGLEEYRTRRKRSARKKRDGPLRDVLQNSAHATAVFLKKSTRASDRVARAVDSKFVWRRVRSAIQLASWPFSR